MPEGSRTSLRDQPRKAARLANLQSCVRRGSAMAMTVELPALERTDADRPASPAPSARLRYFARPALGLLLPVGLALGWEIVVWLGLSSGRLGPPPPKLFPTNQGPPKKRAPPG